MECHGYELQRLYNKAFKRSENFILRVCLLGSLKENICYTFSGECNSIFIYKLTLWFILFHITSRDCGNLTLDYFT